MKILKVKLKVVLSVIEMLFLNTYYLAFLGSVSLFVKRTQSDYVVSKVRPRVGLFSVL